MSALQIAFKKNASKPHFRRLFYLAVLCLIALIDFTVEGKALKTFVFYKVRGGGPTVETRLLPRYESLEVRGGRYVEEALLGPESVDLGRLFPKGTRLESFLFRDGVAYVDLSSFAAVPTDTEVNARRPLETLAAGLKRNFQSIKAVRIFVAGHEPYALEEGRNDDFNPFQKN